MCIGIFWFLGPATTIYEHLLALFVFILGMVLMWLGGS